MGATEDISHVDSHVGVALGEPPVRLTRRGRAVLMTTSSAAAAVESVTPAACMACGHEAADHDRIAQRYCDATIAHASTRACVCAVSKA